MDNYSTYDSGPETVGIVTGVVLAVLWLAMFGFTVYCYMRIARKAGWTLWHGLLVLVPIANLAFMIMFVFMEWPVERRLREAEARLAMMGGGPSYSDPSGGYGGYGAAGYGSAAPYGAPAAPAYGAAPAESTSPVPPVPPAPAAPEPPAAPAAESGPAAPGADGTDPWAPPAR